MADSTHLWERPPGRDDAERERAAVGKRAKRGGTDPRGREPAPTIGWSAVGQQTKKSNRRDAEDAELAMECLTSL